MSNVSLTSRMPIEGSNAPVVESRTEYKVEDDRSFGEKAKDAVKDAAHTVKEAFTPEVTNKDIVKAADKQFKEEKKVMEHAEKAAETKTVDEQLREEKKEMKHAEKAEKQAEKVVHLQEKQSDQNAEKCARALNKHGALHSDDVAVTRVTEIH